MKRWRLACLVTACCLTSVLAEAAWAFSAGGRVDKVTVSNAGQHGQGPWVIVTVTGSTDKAPCALLPGFVFDVSGSSGAALMSTVVLAKEKGRQVTVVGSDICDDVAPGVETLSYIRLQ